MDQAYLFKTETNNPMNKGAGKYGKHKETGKVCLFFNCDNTPKQLQERKGRLLGYRVDESLNLWRDPKDNKMVLVSGLAEKYEMIGFKD